MSKEVQSGFIKENFNGQNVMSFVSELSSVDLRFFMRGPMLDGTLGLAKNIRERLVPLLGEPLHMIAPTQVHGTVILDSLQSNSLPNKPDADGVLLYDKRFEVSLRFADCAPIVIMPSAAEAEKSGLWVLLLHSGFKGTVKNIVRAGLIKVTERFGQNAVNSASAWIGPCIGKASYQRQMEEWTEQGLAVFNKCNVLIAEPYFYFDIASELKVQLIDAGLDSKRIFISNINTAERSDICYSYRCGDKHDRMFLYAKLL